MAQTSVLTLPLAGGFAERLLGTCPPESCEVHLREAIELAGDLSLLRIDGRGLLIETSGTRMMIVWSSIVCIVGVGD
jgi:hypothetical protein